MLIQSARFFVAAAAAASVLLAGCTSEERTGATAETPPDAQGQAPAQANSTSPAQSEAARPVAQVADDAIITGKVKAALVDVEGVKVSDVNVDTVNGAVTLKGFVESRSQAEHAIQLAQATEGVQSVSSQLVVKGAP